MNGDPINSGMGTCGLCGQLGVWTGWVSPSDAALANGAAAMAPTAFDWAGLILISFVLPAVLTWALRPVLPEDRLDQAGGSDPAAVGKCPDRDAVRAIFICSGQGTRDSRSRTTGCIA